MADDPIPTQQPFLATALPEADDRRRSVVAIVVAVAGMIVVAPFAAIPLPRMAAFIPSYEAGLTIIDLLTAVLLLSQFAILRRWSLLVLASAYLFNTVLIAAHALSFPGVFATIGLFGDSQTTGWLYVFWHIGFPLLIIVYAQIADSRFDALQPAVPTARAIAGALVLVALYSGLLIALSRRGESLLPILVVNGDYGLLLSKGVSPAILVVCAVSISTMWRRRLRSVLDVWLFTVLWVWICDVTLSAVVSSARFHLGWYGGRIFGLLASSVLLIAFLFELDRLYARLARAVRDAEARNVELIRSRGELARAQRLEALGQLTGGIAHDFNNLLAAIGGNLELIARRPADAERVARLACHALKISDRGAQLIRRLMSIARQQDLCPEVIETRQALEEFATTIAGIARPSDRIRFELDDAGAIFVDAAELQAALLNLVTNARDAMPDGGEIVVATKTIPAIAADARTVDASTGARVEISVRDHGAGMTPDVQARIFEPFFTTKSLGLGTGLGLSQVHGFAQSAGGGVFVESAPGRGTTVRLSLPRVAPLASSEPAPTPAAMEGSTPHLDILLVEDDHDVLVATRDRLEDLGHTVTTASSGDEAFEMLTRGLAIDLVFTDIVMPGKLSGIALATAARALWPDLKWVLASGFTGGALDRLDLPHNVVFLPKPYTRKELIDKLGVAAAATTG